jgi:general secretion pathway protein D
MRFVALLMLMAQLAEATPAARSLQPPRRPDEGMRAVAPVPADETSLAESLPGGREVLGCHKYPRDKKFRWGVRGEVSVNELVSSLGAISCTPIVVSPQVVSRGGKVLLEIPDVLTAEEVYQLFLSSLEVLGYTVEKSGRTLKVVDIGRVRDSATPQLRGSADAPADQWVTRLLRPKHARPAELAEVLGRMKSKDGEVSPFASGGAVLITDRAGNVRRMEEVVAALDMPRGRLNERIYTVGAHRQTATELVAGLEKVLGAWRRNETNDAKGGGPAQTGSAPLADGLTALIPLDGVRSIVVIGSDAGYRRVLRLLERIDPALQPGEEQGGQAHVLYLKHTNADDMLTTLSTLGLARGAAASPRPQTPTMPGATGMTAPMPSMPSSTGLALTGDVRLAADKVANAIVVIAGNADFPLVRDLITRLDVPRRQVYVECTIVDVSVSRTHDLGLAFHGSGPVAGGATALGASSSSSVSTLVTSTTQLASLLGGSGALAGILGPSVNIAGQSVPSFGVVLKALETQKDAHVLSRPNLLTMDNFKATISVGQTFPYASGSLGAAGASSTLIQTYARQEVALKMEITPHLNDSDSIRLELDGEISDVPDGADVTTPGGPITNKRVIHTAVVVGDGEAVVLGGLQKESQTEYVEKIPFLGDIPILGRLFQSRSKQRGQQDLLIVLTPRVIRGPEDLRRIEAERESEEREFIERFSAFRDEGVYEARVDYRRKRGLLEEIHRAQLAAQNDARALGEAKRQLGSRVVDGVVPDGEGANDDP